MFLWVLICTEKPSGLSSSDLVERPIKFTRKHIIEKKKSNKIKYFGRNYHYFQNFNFFKLYQQIRSITHHLSFNTKQNNKIK